MAGTGEALMNMSFCILSFAVTKESKLQLKKKMKIFDAGAQGEHKLLRGFEPVKTRSLHWIKNEDFRKAISDFLVREKKEIDIQMEACKKILPFKKTTL